MTWAFDAREVDMDLTIRKAAIGIFIGFLAILAEKARADRYCPKCNFPIPTFRLPRTFREFFWGDWRCPECSTWFSRTGRTLSE